MMIYKFIEVYGMISECVNIVVMVDEVYCSQYGFVEGGVWWMCEVLLNVMFVGFIGMLLMVGDCVIQNVFGEYVDVYDVC